MRIFHVAVVVADLEESATFYEEVFGFRRLGARTPGNFPGTAIDLTDNEVHFSLLRPREGLDVTAWSQRSLGPNHVGLQVDDPAEVRSKLETRQATVFGERYSKDDAAKLIYFKCLDPNGAEIDVSQNPFDLSVQ